MTVCFFFFLSLLSPLQSLTKNGNTGAFAKITRMWFKNENYGLKTEASFTVSRFQSLSYGM